MKQLIQNYKNGELQLIEVPTPVLKAGFVQVKNMISLVSVGTEKYMLEMAKKSLLGKAKARPDLVKQVIAKLKANGVIETYKAVMSRLDNSVPLGYSCAGVVLNVGEDVEEFKRGDRVACIGSGYASHAEIVCVPKNLCVHLPRRRLNSYSLSVNREKVPITNDYITFEEGAFVALGGIALQAIRLANPSLGDKVAVIGLGLLGQIAVQLLRANGCHVFGIDISEEKVEMAFENGAEGGAVSGKVDVINSTRELAPYGFDSVIIMAATKKNEPLELAAEIARERGKIVAAGLVGLSIPRNVFFEKELEFVVSRAWGPGVFDPIYIEKNIDYPYPYARWTANRNVEEFLFQIAKGNVDVKKLITHRFKIDDALKAYEIILKGKEPFLGVILNYQEEGHSLSVNGYSERRSKLFVTSYSKSNKKDPHQQKTNNIAQSTPCVGVIGAGLFATGTILPILKKMKGIRLKGVATATGYKVQHVAKKFNFEYFSSDYEEILNDKDINVVFIMTRHGSHAQFVIEALKAGKHIFVEKPLCINKQQLRKIITTYNEIQMTNNVNLMVGFNRRFSPFSTWLKEKYKSVSEPLSIHITVNAGYVPPNHWIHDPKDGGGRIIGEVCHFIDLVQYFTDSVPVKVFAETIDSSSYKPIDNVLITLKMKNGSVGSIMYIAGGDKSYPREKIEIIGGGSVGVINDFKSTEFMSKGKKKRIRKWLGVDRGYKKEMEILITSIINKENPVSFEEYMHTTLATFAIEKSLKEKTQVNINQLN